MSTDDNTPLRLLPKFASLFENSSSEVGNMSLGELKALDILLPEETAPLHARDLRMPTPPPFMEGYPLRRAILLCNCWVWGGMKGDLALPPATTEQDSHARAFLLERLKDHGIESPADAETWAQRRMAPTPETPDT